MREGGTPILRHGRKVLRVMTPLFVILIRCGPYCMVLPDRLTPLSAEKISLCLSHLVPDIRGHKFGLI